VAKASPADRGAGLTHGGNPHPTVKPVALMRRLVRLVTPPGGVVLDCFAGTGTTLVAAKLEGLRSIGIERDAESVAVCARRLAWAAHQMPLLEGTS
jgi:site-specific DNA-methyltransferase (adenine-specific)